MERESLEMDVVLVGAGPAKLSGALHLARLVNEHNESVNRRNREGKSLGEIQIAVIEKGSSVGAHMLSGAVMYPRFFFFQAEDGIRDLIVTGVQTCALPI